MQPRVLQLAALAVQIAVAFTSHGHAAPPGCACEPGQKRCSGRDIQVCRQSVYGHKIHCNWVPTGGKCSKVGDKVNKPGEGASKPSDVRIGKNTGTVKLKQPKVPQTAPPKKQQPN